MNLTTSSVKRIAYHNQKQAPVKKQPLYLNKNSSVSQDSQQQPSVIDLRRNSNLSLKAASLSVTECSLNNHSQERGSQDRFNDSVQSSLNEMARNAYNNYIPHQSSTPIEDEFDDYEDEIDREMLEEQFIDGNGYGDEMIYQPYDQELKPLNETDKIQTGEYIFYDRNNQDLNSDIQVQSSSKKLENYQEQQYDECFDEDVQTELNKTAALRTKIINLENASSANSTYDKTFINGQRFPQQVNEFQDIKPSQQQPVFSQNQQPSLLNPNINVLNASGKSQMHETAVKINVFDIFSGRVQFNDITNSQTSTKLNSGQPSTKNHSRVMSKENTSQLFNLNNLNLSDIGMNTTAKQNQVGTKFLSQQNTLRKANHQSKQSGVFQPNVMSNSSLKACDKENNYSVSLNQSRKNSLQNKFDSVTSPVHAKAVFREPLSIHFDDLTKQQEDYKRKKSIQQSVSSVCTTDSIMRLYNDEIHKLRKSNAKLRDDYSRSTKRLNQTSKELNQLQRDKKMQEVVKQKDFEYIIKQDKQLEQYKQSYTKLSGKYQQMKEELKKYKDQLENREALISATELALDHVIQCAQQNNEEGYTLETLINIRSQLTQIKH